jgi:hypothetical protein
MFVGRRSRNCAAVLFVGALVPLALADDRNAAKQREQQKQIQARVNEAARRTSWAIDTMTYQRLAPSTERKMLDEVAKGLRGLSDVEIKQVLDHLEAAAAAEAAKNPDKATTEQQAALLKQRQVISELRGMLVKLDVIKNLDDAAARLLAAADKQLAVNDATLTEMRLPRRPGRRGEVLDSREELAGEQGDLRTEVAAILKQVQTLTPHLTPQQKERVERAAVATRGTRLVAEMDSTTRSVRAGQYDDAGTRQRRHAKELQDLAAALRTPEPDRIAALKAAEKKINEAIDAQTKVNNNTKEPLTPEEIDKAQRSRFDPKMVKGNELAAQQTKAEFATREARKTAERAAPEVADLLKPAENKQWDSEDALRQGKMDNAKDAQEKAIDDLKSAKAELDRQIAAAELAKADPLAAVKQAAERVDQLIQDQKDANKKTDRAEKSLDKLPDAQAAQKDVARDTDDVRAMPLPPNNQAKDALNRAAESMKEANKDLAARKPADARPEQQQALKSLEDAKKALEEQAKQIEQRRADIARLEDLKNKLEELVKDEKQVAKEADKAASDPQKPDTGDIAKKQDNLAPPTKDVGDELKQLADQNKNADPKGSEQLKQASDKVADANKKQDGAKSDLAMNMPKAGGEKATDAAKKLDEAAKDVQAQLDQKKGMEANDQAALQPNKVDPNNAAQQLQKAIDQANLAAEKANEAAKNQQPTDGMPMKGQPNIAEMQKEIAKQAGDQKLPEAARSADKAAQALEKGDIPNAIENQEKALDQFNQAAQQAMGMQPDGKSLDQLGLGAKLRAEKGKGGEPSGQLAQQQQRVLDATRALQQSQQATNSAQAALQQAQANTPMSVQPQLNQANNDLQQAQGQLQQGQPSQAGMNQQNAAQQLQQALNSLNAAQQQAQGMGMGQQGMGMGMGMAQGMGMGQGMGMAQGMAQGMGQGMGMGMGQPGQTGMGMGQNAQQATNEGMSEGDPMGGEKLKNSRSSANNASGDGSFIHLRKKEREKVQQGADAQFPAEFRELIKQYNVNVKNAKPAPGK